MILHQTYYLSQFQQDDIKVVLDIRYGYNVKLKKAFAVLHYLAVNDTEKTISVWLDINNKTNE